MASRVKNTLSQMLGSYLKVERNALGISGTEMAKRLDLGASFYRMIESGNANLHPNRAPLIIREFGESKIDFERLCKLLIGIQFLAFCIGKNESEDFAINFLGSIDKDFSTLKKSILEYSNLEEGSYEQKKFLQKTSVREISNFLSLDYYTASESSDFEGSIYQKIQKTKSLNLELVLDLIDSLSKHPPMHMSGIASKWEYDNKHRFTSLIGLYQSHEIIINNENLERFNYPYIWENQFNSLRYIFLNAPKSREAMLKNKFVSILNEVRTKENLPTFEIEEANKISFRCRKGFSSEKVEELLRGDIYGGRLSAFWLFTTENGGQIAFVGVKRGNTDYIINLDFYEAQNRKKLFDQLWGEFE